MKVTNVLRFNKFEKGPMLGFADVEFDDCFRVNGIKLMTGSNGYWLGWPSIKKDEGKYDPTVVLYTTFKDRTCPEGDILQEDLLTKILLKRDTESKSDTRQDRPLSPSSKPDDIPF